MLGEAVTAGAVERDDPELVLEITTEPVLDAGAELCEPAGEDSGETPVDSGRVEVEVRAGAV